ncbi:GumC family protein [Uliginosibacterium paludis]|uniref:non-specific protein-tyrosine kinase n=1 Tax=Uliginosibacterium paludis TaxID=1615952 RepID=A0ABV2CNL7_9RHOO
MSRLEARYLRFERSAPGATGLSELAGYARSIARKRWLVLGCGCFCAALAIFLALQATPRFESTAMLLVDDEGGRILSIDDTTSEGAGGRAHYMTQLEYLQSYKLGLQVISSLALWEEPGFDPRREPPSPLDRLLALAGRPRPQPDWTPELLAEACWGRFAKSLRILPVPESRLILVSFSATEPAFAARVSNAVVNAYLEALQATRLMLNDHASARLSAEENRLLAQLDESQQSLQSFRNAKGMARLNGSDQTLVALQIAQLTGRLAQAHTRRVTAESAWEQARNTAPADYAHLPGVQAGAGVGEAASQLDAARVRLAELSQRYGPEHPRMLEARAEEDTARAHLNQLSQQAVAALERDALAASAAETALRTELAIARSRVQDLNRNEAALDTLSLNAAGDRQLYDITRNRRNELSALRDIKADPVRLIQPARPEFTPHRPSPLLLGLGGLVGGMLLCALAVLIRERFWLVFHDAQELEQRSGLPVLAELSSDEDFDPAALARTTLNRPASGFSEAVRTLRSAVLLSDIDLPCRRILVTSSLPGEGKTTLAANLAYSLAATGRCLLIDADMRRAGLSGRLGLSREQAGLSDLLARPERVDCIHRREAGLDLIPSGSLSEQPLELLSSTAFADLLAGLAPRYDSIVIDSPPLLPVSDAQLIAALCDRTLLVVRARLTPWSVLRRSLALLSRSRARPLGIAFNDSRRPEVQHAAEPIELSDALMN